MKKEILFMNVRHMDNLYFTEVVYNGIRFRGGASKRPVGFIVDSVYRQNTSEFYFYYPKALL